MARLQVKTNWLDRAIGFFAPHAALRRVRARTQLATLRNYEAAQAGRRTSGWRRTTGDANSVIGPALAPLRELTRNLLRNNAWARSGRRTITRNVVGWGIYPKAAGVDVQTGKVIADLWKRWAGSTECDADGRLTFYGLQKLAMSCVVESGEVLVRRRWRQPRDGLTLPMQLQVLEPDFIDTSKDGVTGQQSGPVRQGIEFDAIGRRVAYWLFPEHPGSRYAGAAASKRISAGDVIHVYEMERPGQGRGASAFASVISTLNDFDEYEDGTIMRQKIAALFAAFVTDPNGSVDALGEKDSGDAKLEEFEPGMIKYLAPGQTVEFASPPLVQNDGFSVRTLRRVGAGIGTTYEDLTGDFSQVNYSSARMARLAHWGNVYDWQWNMLVPQLCDPTWAWAMEAAVLAGLVESIPLAEWTAPPMPMIDPDKEGLAYMRRVRSGAMTPSEMVREQGRDPDTHWTEYAQDIKKLDALGITIDSDARKVSQSGQAQQATGDLGGGQ